VDGGTDCSHHISKIKLNEIKLGLLQSIYVQVWHLAIFCASPRLSQQQALTTSLAPGMQADSVQNCPLNTQESVNKPATIPQTSSSHVPTIALSPLSQSKSSIYSSLFFFPLLQFGMNYLPLSGSQTHWTPLNAD